MAIYVRTRLRELLKKAIKSPLVTVTAPPGYGKTLAVTDFIIHSGMQSICTKVTRLDNDPIRFWDSFVLAAEERFPLMAARLRTLGFPGTDSEILDFVHILDEETAGSLPVIFVFDDFGRVAEGAVGRLMEHVLEIEPRECRFILISSVKTGIDVTALRGNGVFQINLDDLRFTETEVREYFLSRGINLPRADVHRIIKYTEGWPLALRLINPQLISKSMGLKYEIVQSLFELDYFYCYDEEVRNALIKLSLLRSFILENLKDTGLLDRSLAVESIMSNLFISYDPDTRRYSMHNMFREFLKGWQSTLSELDKKVFRLRAGETFMESSCLPEAIDCYEKCGNYDKMLAALERYYHVKGETLLDETEYIMAKLERFPKEFSAHNPLIGYLKAVIYYVNNELGQCEETLRALILCVEGSSSGFGEDTILANTNAEGSSLGNGVLDSGFGTDTIFEIDDADRDTVSKVQGSTAGAGAEADSFEILGNAYYILGCIGMSCCRADFGKYFKKSAAYLKVPHITDRKLFKPVLFHVGNYSVMGMDGKEAGALARMENAFKENIPYYKGASGSGAGLSFLFSAEAAFYTMNLDSARFYAREAMREASYNDQHDIFLNAVFVLARAALLRGDCTEMSKQVGIITDYVDNHDMPSLRILSDSVVGWLYLNMGLPGMVPPQVVNPAMLKRNPRFNIRCRVNVLHAYYLVLTDKFEELQSHLYRMEDEFTKWIDQLNIHIMRAIAGMKLGRSDEAMENLWKAYEMSRENGVVAPFAELGHPMYALVEFAKKNNALGFDPLWLDDISGKSASFAKRLSIAAKEFHAGSRGSDFEGVRLTVREMEVLSDLSQGKTREEIARSNFISVNTVKSIIKNIYGKLGAVNRADAIRISTNLGILDNRLPH